LYAYYIILYKFYQVTTANNMNQQTENKW
jgi:hypothetical protein